jgi:2-oxo-4-hydroxy-4-carboxy-5-ureidoimidazoline decarboxylase
MPAGIDELDVMPGAAFVAELSPLFEGAPGFLTRLASARPFRDWPALWDAADRIAATMPEADQVELLDAHPRLGAPKGSVSAMSFLEQGYDRDAADAAAERERRRVDDELARLNAAYEQTFGFRYCVFVAGRPRAALLDDFARALTNDRDAELARGLADVVRIARDRQQQRAGER